MIKRRGHKKSRNGCDQCKARKVKCDETKPWCSNCTRNAVLGVQCTYRTVPAASPRAPSQPPEVPAPTMAASAYRSVSQTASIPSTPEAILGQFPTANLEVDRVQMELLHTYSTSTCYTLSRNPVIQAIWRVQVPKVGFFADYVMYSILSLASLHIAYFRPLQKERYITYAMQLLEAALRIATSILPNVSDDNCVSLYTFAALSCFISFAKPRKPGNIFPFNNDGEPDFIIIFRGLRTILESTKGRMTLKESAVGPLFVIGGRRRSTRDSRPRGAIECLDSLLLLITDTVQDEEKLGIYSLAIDELAKSYVMVQESSTIGDSCQVSDVFFWLFIVSDEYLDLLSQRSQEALVIFAHFCVLIKDIEWAWWMNGWSLHLISFIYYALDQEHRTWLQWPVEQLGWIQG